MAKILIIEDWMMSACFLASEADKDDYETVILARDFDRNYVLENLEKTIINEKPDFMITDGLHGKCFEAIEIGKKTFPSMVSMLYTTDAELINKAKEMGIAAYRKKNDQELTNLFWKIYELSKRDC